MSGPGRDPLVDRLADRMFLAIASADDHDWQDHKRARAALDLLATEGRLVDPVRRRRRRKLAEAMAVAALVAAWLAPSPRRCRS